MRWEEFDDHGRLWYIPGGRTKNGRPHTVPIVPQTVSLIQSVPVEIVRSDGRVPSLPHSSYVFPSRTDASQSYSGFSKAKRALNANSGVQNWTLHDLRRTVASRMGELGVQPHIIEKVLNHTGGSFAGVAGVYNRYEYLDEKRTALELWATRLVAIVGAPRFLACRGSSNSDQSTARLGADGDTQTLSPEQN